MGDGPVFTSAPVPLVLHCNACDTDKPAVEFYAYSPTRCKDCCRDYQTRRRAERRAEMGDAAWLAHQRAIVARHRANGGNVKTRAYARAQAAALRALVDLHRAEYEHLLLLARRGELQR